MGCHGVGRALDALPLTGLFEIPVQRGVSPIHGAHWIPAFQERGRILERVFDNTAYGVATGNALDLLELLDRRGKSTTYNERTPG